MNLPTKEFQLYFYYALIQDKFTRESIIEKIWGFDYTGDERTVDVHIKRLRTRLKIRGNY